jgi:DNA polymerase-3 subunit gamma/tau
VSTINSVNSDGVDLRQFNREVVEYLRELLLIKTGSEEAVDLTAEDLAELKDLASKASLSQILKAVKLFGQLKIGFDNYSPLPLELTLVDCIQSTEAGRDSQTSQPESRQPAEVTEPPAAPSPKKPVAKAPKQSAATKPEPAITPEPEPEPPVAAEAEAAPPPPKPPATKTEPVSTPAPEPPAAPTTPLEPGDEIEHLRKNWKQVIEQAPEHTKKTPAIAILRSAGIIPLASEDDTIILAFKYPLHKENMEKPENQKIAEEIIGNFLGRPCRIRCTQQRDNNHLVKAALKMGAQIIDVEEK